MLIKIQEIKNNLLNANVMLDEIREKLVSNIKEQGGKYPRIIVRRISEPPTEFDIKNTDGKPEGYRIIDGHNRLWALKQLEYKEVECDVWDVDDKTEMLLLATLNELKGTQDLTKRAVLLKTIIDLSVPRESLIKLLPEDNRRLDFILSIAENRDLGELDSNENVQAERNALIKKFMDDGIDSKRAEAMADIYSYKKYVPTEKSDIEGKKFGQRPLLIFFFPNVEDYKKACDFFETPDGEKEPNCEKLMKLINESIL